VDHNWAVILDAISKVAKALSEGRKIYSIKVNTSEKILTTLGPSEDEEE
jgi:hypothetical protein